MLKVSLHFDLLILFSKFSKFNNRWIIWYYIVIFRMLEVESNIKLKERSKVINAEDIGNVI